MRKDAQAQHARAEDRLAANYQEHARRFYLDGDPVRAFAYAVEARALGARGSEIEYLLERMLGTLSREQAVLDAGGRVQSLIETAEGRLIATSADGTTRIWDARGRVLGTCRPRDMAADRADASASGDTIATVRWDGTARPWDGHTCAPRAALAGHAGRVFWAGLRADGGRLFTTGTERSARILDAHTGARHDGTRLADLPHGPMESLALDPGGGRLLLAGPDRTARVIDARTGALIRALDHPDGIATAVWDRASSDHTVRLWTLDAPDATLLAPATAYASFDATGTVVVAARGGEVGLWDAATGVKRCTLVHGDEVGAAEVSPDAALVATGDVRGRVRIWDARSCAPRIELQAHAGAVWTVGFAPHGSRVVTGGADGTAKLWDASSGAAVGAIPIGASIASAGFSPDGRTLFVMQDHDDMTSAAPSAGLLFDARTLARTATLWHARPLLRLAFTRDGHVVTMSRDGTAVLWRADGVPTARIVAPASSWFDTDVDRDGRRVVTCGQDPAPLVWDARTGARIGALARHAGYVLSCRFSADGRFIVTASTDGTAKLWDVATLAPIESFTLSDAPIRRWNRRRGSTRASASS